MPQSIFSGFVSITVVPSSALLYVPLEEFIQSVQSTAGMAVVLLIRCVMEEEETVAEEVSHRNLDVSEMTVDRSHIGLYSSSTA